MNYDLVRKPAAYEASAAERPYSLSVVVPVFNEEENILRFITTVDEVLLSDAARRDLVGLEYLFVNDGSTDRTEIVIRQLAKHDKRIRLINLSRNFGKEAALCAGLKHAAGDAVVPMDVDMQDPPSLLPEMIAQWRAGAKVVNAQRIDRTSDTRFKRWTSALFYKVINKLADYDVPSDVGDFRLLDRDAIAVLNELTEHSRFNKGLFSWIGFQVATVEYARPARSAGTTKWRPGKLIGLAVDGIVSSTTLPLRIWTLLGAGIAAGAFAYALFLIVSTLVGGVDVPGYASLMVVTLGLGGLNLVSLGLIGEYLGRVAVQVRGRPLYVIASTVGGDDDL
jgi:glycosyltransferase involved in cell wall biosynthesis